MGAVGTFASDLQIDIENLGNTHMDQFLLSSDSLMPCCEPIDGWYIMIQSLMLLVIKLNPGNALIKPSSKCLSYMHYITQVELPTIPPLKRYAPAYP
jgi:hypothetical protein